MRGVPPWRDRSPRRSKLSMAKKKHKKYLEQKKNQSRGEVLTTSVKSHTDQSSSAKTVIDQSNSGRDIMKYKFWYLGFSALILVPCVISLALFGLKTSIDFTGGSVLKFSRTEGMWDKTAIEQVFVDKKVEVAQILLDDGGKTATIRTKPIDSNKNEEIKSVLIPPVTNKDQPETRQSNVIIQTSFETVGSSIGAETAKKSLIAFGVACAGIVFYIAYAFRNIPKPYSSLRFGVSAILAMAHDALIVTGVFSILGHFKGIEVDPMFITALLTIIGFSVHDTIVVFDRVRENLGKFKGKNIEWIANFSILETMRRSIATSATVAITLSALFVFGGASIKYFVLALLIGVISGTYSSIFNATPILVIWEDFLGRQKKH